MNIGDLWSTTPTVNFAARTVTDSAQQWGPRLIPDCQFYYVVSGRADLQLGPDPYEVHPGDCVFYGTDSPHILRADPGTDYYSLHFAWHADSPSPVHPAGGLRHDAALDMSGKAQEYGVYAEGFGHVTVPHRFTVPGMQPLLQRIVHEYTQEQPGYPYVLRALLMELLAFTIRHFADRSHTPRRSGKIEAALGAMRDQPGKNWSVAELAGLCGYHPSHFAKLFSSEIGTNPKSYLIKERLRQTKQALLRGEKLEALADRLGYTSVHYLSNHFKRETGLTPSEFRQQGASMGT
ncbi:helix-turn-helix transcriptional regulator [Paenibacillus oceani]|uniref:AraC family transcriptional regulator n=1 Tax=Paenibacillus oceani TaxID=2772510 RepID=A0A927H2W8_9BACL|nr:AraC family transcriptional regulator [Paenibacillus oceani]MBD2865803.1 AraC family transcriptional regulator [Paenibacillus oceani]